MTQEIMEVKKTMLHELGRLIRSVGRKSPKRHGNYWYFNIGDNHYFMHDDYNYCVSLKKSGNSVKYFGIDFGGFETRLDMEDFEHAINIIKGFIALTKDENADIDQNGIPDIAEGKKQ